MGVGKLEAFKLISSTQGAIEEEAILSTQLPVCTSLHSLYDTHLDVFLVLLCQIF